MKNLYMELINKFQEVPADREHLVARKEGYMYMLVTVEVIPGKQFGLGQKHFKNQVIVSDIQSG